MGLVAIAAAIVFLPLAIEARRARTNERRQRARGGIEPSGDVYRFMQIVYPGAFAAMLIEGAVRGGPPPAAFGIGAAVFVAAKALKWAAIDALGDAWTFRVIVVPGAPLVTRGPYRFLRHPNYVAVCGELIGTALMTSAVVTGPVSLVSFGALMLKRIHVEERALTRGRA